MKRLKVKKANKKSTMTKTETYKQHTVMQLKYISTSNKLTSKLKVQKKTKNPSFQH